MSKIYIGIGGWTFEEWRDNFYPKGLSQKRELEYASRHLTAIEINGTYYGSQKPESFARWHDVAPRYSRTHRIESGSRIQLAVRYT